MVPFVVGQIESARNDAASAIFICVVLTVVVGGIIAFTYWSRKEAKENYETAYSRFAANPLDKRLRDRALASAEEYSHAASADYSETGIHAASLRQSIETLHRAAKESAEVKKLVADKAVGPADRLDELQKMMDKGLISDEEFQAKRAQILEEV